MSPRITYTTDGNGGVQAHAGKRGFNEGHGWFVGELKYWPPSVGEPTNVFEISDISVHEDYWRRGIGSELLRRAEQEIREKGGTLVVVTPGDDAAEQFWMANGYSRDLDEPPNNYAMSKALK